MIGVQGQSDYDDDEDAEYVEDLMVMEQDSSSISQQEDFPDNINNQDEASESDASHSQQNIEVHEDDDDAYLEEDDSELELDDPGYHSIYVYVETNNS